MALPPLNAPSSAPDAGGLPVPDDAGGEPEVIATILRLPDGKFALVEGDEPEAGPMPAGGGVDGPTLLKRLMGLLEGGAGEQAGMEAGYSDEGGDTSIPQQPMPG